MRLDNPEDEDPGLIERKGKDFLRIASGRYSRDAAVTGFSKTGIRKEKEGKKPLLFTNHKEEYILIRIQTIVGGNYDECF